MQRHSAVQRSAGRNVRYTRCRRGVTLLEVLAGIMNMGVGMLAVLSLFPLGALSMRRSVNESRAAADTSALSGAIVSFRTNQLRLPTSIAELAPYLGANVALADAKEDGYGFSMDATGAVTAAPAVPGKTGTRWFRKPIGGPVADITSSAALQRSKAAEKILMDDVRALVAEASSDVLRLDTTGQAPFLARQYCLSQPISGIFASMDANHNARVSWQELLAPDPLIARITLFRSRVGTKLQLGAADEHVDAFPGLQLSSFQGDPGFVYTFDSLRFMVNRYLPVGSLRTNLIAKLNAAEAEAIAGHLSQKRALLSSFTQTVRAQQGVALTAAQVGVLTMLAATLWP